MKLNKFIKELEDISKKIDNIDKIEVRMADYIPVVKPILRGDTVFITDVKQKPRLSGGI